MKGPPPNSTPDQYCHLCGGGPSLPIEGFEELHRVTSDCKSWPSGGRLLFCQSCGTVHKNTDAAWLEEIGKIYADYDIYHLSGGVEQAIFVPSAGGLASRSQRLLQQLTQEVALPEQGRLLDIGCGNGSFLQVFSQDLPGWTSVGTEFNDKYKQRVESIHNVERVHTGPLHEVDGFFQLVAMIHVLEHIPWPAQHMATLLSKLAVGGKLLIDLPHHQLNPYDLLIADHCTHFSEASLARFLAGHGFSPSIVTSQWVRKELVAVAEPHDNPPPGPALDCEHALLRVKAAIAYLHLVVRAARQLRSQGSLAIFGTSIAGTWLAGSLQGDFDFWVEEDPTRLGRDYLGKKLYPPQAVPAGSQVLIALAPELSGMLRDKLLQSCPQVRWFVPEDWSD